MFKQKEIRKTVKAKAGNKNINIQIINYNDEMYDKWKLVIGKAYISGKEQLELQDTEINELFNDFTNIQMSTDELNDILDNPNHTFSIVFKELQLILHEMVVRFLQEKQIEMITIKKQIEETKILMVSDEIEKAFNDLAKRKEGLVNTTNG